MAFRIQAQRARVVQAALGDDVGLIGTVPLVASALPALVALGDHQRATAGPAGATTSNREPGVAVGDVG
jgi:hypothetical protein